MFSLPGCGKVSSMEGSERRHVAKGSETGGSQKTDLHAEGARSGGSHVRARDHRTTRGLEQRRLGDAALPDRDRFCRRCGVRQSHGVDPFNSLTGGLTGDVIGRANRVGNESGLSSGVGSLRRSHSGVPVGIVTRELSVRAPSPRANLEPQTD
jgi:hypothetical protein